MPVAAAVPVLLMANPKKPSPKKPSKPKKKPAKKNAPKKEKKNMAKRKTPKRDAHGHFVATKKATPHKGKGKKRNPSNPSHKPRRRKPSGGHAAPRRRRRNPEGGKGRGMAAALTAGGAVLGAAGAGAAEYGLAGTEMFASPGKRALVHGLVSLLGVGASAAFPKAAPLIAGVAGAFAGNAGTDGIKALASGSVSKSQSDKATGGDKGGTVMTGGVVEPSDDMRGIGQSRQARALAAGTGMRGATMEGGVVDMETMRGIVRRGRR